MASLLLPVVLVVAILKDIKLCKIFANDIGFCSLPDHCPTLSQPQIYMMCIVQRQLYSFFGN